MKWASSLNTKQMHENRDQDPVCNYFSVSVLIFVSRCTGKCMQWKDSSSTSTLLKKIIIYHCGKSQCFLEHYFILRHSFSFSLVAKILRHLCVQINNQSTREIILLSTLNRIATWTKFVHMTATRETISLPMINHIWWDLSNHHVTEQANKA